MKTHPRKSDRIPALEDSLYGGGSPLSPSASVSAPQSPFADLFPCTSAQARYLDAPLLEERSHYISHLLRQGASRGRIKSTASMQVRAVKLLNLGEARPVGAREVQKACSQWADDLGVHQRKRPGRSSCNNFTHAVTKWLEFSGLFALEGALILPFEGPVTQYLDELRLNGLSELTIRHRRHELSKFQMWLGERHSSLAEVSLNDIDSYLDSRRVNGWGQRTLRNSCAIIRWFFRFCESQNWCRIGLARGIVMPRATKAKSGPIGPAWKDVRRMLRVDDESPGELRANAIVCLCSIYALRNSEILHLRLDDFDWYNEIMIVRRAKGGPVQQFPIRHEVGKAILAYLKSARPKSNCRFLFTTFRPPIRPMGPTCIQQTVAKRMKALKVRSEKFGPHALRHSCATHLLNKGFSLSEIADFLGHRGLHSVSIYAKYNPRILRRVASFGLAGIQ